MSQIKFEILGVKLVAIEDKINHQTYLVEMKPINLNIKWGGAGVIIVNRELDFKTSDYLVISPFANAIAWYFDAVKKEYVSRRDFVIEKLNKMDNVFCPNPSGAFYCIARLPIDNADKFCQWLLEDFSYKGQTVMLAPATGFYSTPGAGINEVRIAYVLNIESLTNAMECLSEALKVYPGRV